MCSSIIRRTIDIPLEAPGFEINQRENEREREREKVVP